MKCFGDCLSIEKKFPNFSCVKEMALLADKKKNFLAVCLQSTSIEKKEGSGGGRRFV